MVRLESFDGPLALLLALIEQRQLDVLTVPLAALAGAYLEALASLAGPRLPHLSAFVAVAAQLIVIKSRAMLPRRSAAESPAVDEGPDPEEELRSRLLLYRAYRDAGALLGARPPWWRLFRREPGTAQAAGLAGARPLPAPPFDPALLAAALGRLAELAPPPPLPVEIVRRSVSLAERAEAIHNALRGASVVVLQDLLGDMHDRVLAAVTFLAMLELVKRREIVAEQDEPWGPIRCRALAPSSASTVPIDEKLAGFA
jgi:segregation and condensation protein A